MNNGLLSFDPAQTVKMSSREISILTDKEHKHVLRDIKTMVVDLYAGKLPSEREGRSKHIADNLSELFDKTVKDGPSVDHQKNQALSNIQVVLDPRGYVSEILLDYRHTMNLMTGYSRRLRDAVISRWMELERKTTSPALTTAEMIAAIANNAVKTERELAETKALALDSADRIAALETKLLPGATMHHSDCPADSEIKSRALRRKHKETGMSLAVCERIFDLYSENLWKGETCVNPNPAVPGHKPCRVYKIKDINAAFKHFLRYVKPVGNGYFTDKDIPTRFRVPCLERE
ncbi:Rha family transcriptional regulator [Burkholderia cenocepacia]|uniref:Rha family transcriptional regulator n=1 Tax=Burkholderia cenocepacia TaxID=95486 RepID=UPI001AA0EFFD|nr:Rha family transcriptional regulator [Burkholderia cenocepacia]MBO1854626.1 Rha family transcriptional regulator [Burkholderia cenocepacia]